MRSFYSLLVSVFFGGCLVALIGATLPPTDHEPTDKEVVCEIGYRRAVTQLGRDLTSPFFARTSVVGYQTSTGWRVRGQVEAEYNDTLSHGWTADLSRCPGGWMVERIELD